MKRKIGGSSASPSDDFGEAVKAMDLSEQC